VHRINLALTVNWDRSVNETVLCRNPAASVAEVRNCLVNKEERGCSQNSSSWMLPWRSGFWPCLYHRVPKWC